MLDQNTDRMWYVIGAVIIGAAIIFILNNTFPQLFASVGNTFKDKVDSTALIVDDINVVDKNYIRDFGTGNYRSNYVYPGELSDDEEMGAVVKVTTLAENIDLGRAGGIYAIPTRSLQIGNSYNLSVYVKSESPTMRFHLAIDGNQIANSQEFEITDEWQKIEATFINGGVNVRPRFYSTDLGTFYISQGTLTDSVEE